ncbi:MULTISPECIES: homoprotocatechuate degradation operon regulator HpaR [unclassified Bosea (in: a-proteobacteria)]|uniref:homoprotocatechuate degradation operon regulator HpaR n=1 Tax=unclassified Bosea (in: a-proteobacteria) TaxID=2653178 RepID=UPI00125ECEA4|nr:MULTISPECIES: homoprotocatechuate degradation operon regulator HpaR [unclassified Bosea (in: a-proteobacteria)]
MSLLRARESVMRHFRKSLREFGVTEQQWRVLRALSTKPQMEVAELARATFLLGPSLSRILVDLDQRGLIRREPDPADLRRWMISLSPSGTELIDTVTPVSEAIYREISQRFGEDRLGQLQDLLAELEEAMAGIGNDGPDAPAD